MIVSLDAGKTLDKIEHLLMIKAFSDLGIEGNFFSLVKGVYEKPTVNVIFNDDRLTAFPL